MSRIEMYAKSDVNTLESAVNSRPNTLQNSLDGSLESSLEILKLQRGHKIFSPAEMLSIFSQMRKDDALESPAVDHPEYRGQSWLDVEPNMPYSLRPRIPPPTPPKERAVLSENVGHHQAPALHSRDLLASRIDPQSSLFQDRTYSPMRTPLAPAPAVNPVMGTRILSGGAHLAGDNGISGYQPQQPMFLAGGAGGWGMPPGLQPRLVSPDTIQWVYTDPNGVQQGPFTGQAMNQWYMGGWLRDDLYVKRVHDSEFIPIGNLKQKLNTENIFMVQASQEAWDAAFGLVPQQPQQPQQPPQPQIPAIAQAVQSRSSTPFGWANSGSTGLSQSMWGSQTHLHTPTRSLTPSTPQQPVKQELVSHEKEFSGLLQELNIQSDDEPLPTRSTPNAAPAPIRPIAAPAQTAPIAQPAPIQPASVEPAQPVQPIVSPTVDPVPAPLLVEAIAAPEVVDTTDVSLTPEQATETTESEAVHQADPERKEPEAAPWASKRPVVKQAINLAQVQAQEAAKRKEEQAKQRAAAQSLAAHQAASTPEIMRSTPLGIPGGAWGTPATATAPKRSVADIQREQALAQKTKAATAPKPVSAWSTANYAEVSRPAPGVMKQQVPLGPAAASPASPWQTVNRKSKVVTGTPAYPSSTPAAPAAPAAAPVPKGPEQMKPASRTDELVQWAKNTFKQSLSKDVNPDELLSLFLTLPNTADAKDFITESIYSYSSTLDGRRFASDFVQRRKEAEASMKPNETWTDILNQSNPNAADIDPSFKVVTKKRYRQIVKPTI